MAQAAVTVVTDPAGDKQLAAYLRPEPGSEPDPANLRVHLARTLPAYMIPAYLVSLDKFPLNASGKVDKAALPPPETLTDMFAALLGLEEVSATSSFFDIGGSSLHAMRLITMLDAELQVDIGVTEVFLAPTPQQLAALLRDKHGLEDADLDAGDMAGPQDLADEQPGPVLTPVTGR